MDGVGRYIGYVGVVVLIVSGVGVALGAGTTTVGVQPATTTVDTGDTTRVDIVLESADGGVGSVDMELTVTDDVVANVTNVTVAGDPSTVDTTASSNGARIIATGMDTVDSGPVTVATVTLSSESVGTSTLDLTVAAIGDESGTAYDIDTTNNGQLTVEGEENETTPAPTPSPTPTATETETDESSSGGGNADIDIIESQLNATTVEVGEAVETTVELENTGSQSGDRYFSYRLNGAIEETGYVYLESGETTTVTFTTTFESTGEYDIDVAEQTPVGTITVTQTETGDTNTTQTTATIENETVDTATPSPTTTTTEEPTLTATASPVATVSASQSPAPTENTSEASPQARTTTDGPTTTFEAGGSLTIGLVVVSILAVVGGLLLYRL